MTLSSLLQAIADGILTGAILSLSAIGLSLTMGVLRFANFSHAELISWGAYVTWAPIALIGAALGAMNAPLDPFSFGPALIFSAIIGAAGAILVALLIDRLVFRPLRGRAIAGLMGNPQARIFCRKMEAELLAIDGLYRTADDMEQALRGKPVQAWLQGDSMVLAALD